MLGKFEGGSDQGKAGLVAGHAGEPLALAHGVGQLLARFLLEAGFVVEEVDLGGAARLEEIDHPLGLGGVVKGLSGLGVEHIGQGQSPESSPEALEEIATGHAEGGFVPGAERLVFHGHPYLLERVSSKFMRVETKLATAASRSEFLVLAR